jgi:lysophospholipase L1-like esterase
MTPRSLRPRRGALAAFAAALAVGAGELTLRLLDFPRPSLEFLGPELEIAEVYARDPRLFWKINPATTFYSANALGLRGHLPALDKTPRAFRIACVGDSCTFGLTVRYDEAYGVRLERMLQHRLPDRYVEVMLAAVGGYSSHQSRVLFEAHVAPRRPDLTILYCGAFNDAVPAIGLTDAERASSWRSLRLVQLASRAFGAEGKALVNRDEYVAALKAGRAPDGRRVPLPRYRDNLRAIIAAARAAGSEVVVVLPPYPRETEAEMPFLLEYRGATAEVARDLATWLLDGNAALRPQQELAPLAWQQAPAHGWPCFNDAVHPSAYGHALLARALCDLVSDRLQLPPPATVPPARSGLRIDRVSPAAIELGSGTRVVVEGSGFAGSGPLRAWLGDHWVREATLLGDHRMELAVPREALPGRHAVEIATAAGLVRSEAAVELMAPRLHAALERAGDELELRVSCSGPAAASLGVWLSDALAAAPIATQFGPLWLAGGEGGRLAELPEAPLRVDRLPLPYCSGTFDAQGKCEIRQRLPAGAAARRTFAQGLIADPAAPWRSVLTQAVEAAAPR